MPKSGIRKFFDIVAEMKEAVSLGVGEPDFDTPWHIRDEGIYSLEKGRTLYTSNAGLKELRVEICRWLNRHYDLEYEPNTEVLVTVGGSEGIDLTMRAMLEPGDEVIMPSYTFVSTADAFVLRGATPVFVDMRPDTMNIDETKIEAAITEHTKGIVPVHYAGVACLAHLFHGVAHRFG